MMPKMQITKPIISPDFTIEDIHKIRDYHYALTKDMSIEERCRFYNEKAQAGILAVERLRRQRGM